MGFHTKPSSVSLILFFFFFFFTTPLVIFVHATTIGSSDITNFIYRGCAYRKFPDPSDVYTQNLKTLLSTLVSQSSQKNFSAATSGEGQTAIMGLYQCRGDLTNPQCYTCVSKSQDLAYKSCSKGVVAARIQLSGCYLKYEVSGFVQVPGTQLLYKICGSDRGVPSGFEQKREMAFDMVTNGIKNSTGGLFYTGSYEQVYVLGQCEGDLASGDCVDCLKAATEMAKTECGDSISGQVFLNKCFFSYRYYSNGVPGPNSSSSSSSSSSEGSGSGQQHTQRTVAMVVGIVAGVFFLLVVLMCVKSVMKKRKSQNHW